MVRRDAQCSKATGIGMAANGGLEGLDFGRYNILIVVLVLSIFNKFLRMYIPITEELTSRFWSDLSISAFYKV